MQSQAEAEAVAYDSVLRQAERHENGWRGELPGTCATCANHLHLGVDDEAELCRTLPDSVDGRICVARSLVARLGVCRLAMDRPAEFMGVLYRDDDSCDEWEEGE